MLRSVGAALSLVPMLSIRPAPEEVKPKAPEVGFYVPYRQTWTLLGYSRGEPLNTISLAPQEETTIELFIWDRRTNALEQTSASEVEQTIESTDSTKDTTQVLGELALLRLVVSGRRSRYCIGDWLEARVVRACWVSVPREVIAVAVRWYLRYGLSYRDVEEVLAERGITVDHVTVYRWVQTFTSEFLDAARPARHSTGDRWFVDETYVKVAGRWTYLYRAVDQYGQVIDVRVSSRRGTAFARAACWTVAGRGDDRSGTGLLACARRARPWRAARRRAVCEQRRRG